MELNQYIDHTLLKPEATQAQIIALCEEAKHYNFMSVCVNPVNVALARKRTCEEQMLTYVQLLVSHWGQHH
ncbi:hypothetical protein MGH68_09410 [Erysipelothrix sp. D19-032]